MGQSPQLGPTPVGAPYSRAIRLRGPSGAEVTTLAGSEPLSCRLWAGDGTAPTATPSAAWVRADASGAVLRVTLAPADTAGLEPGTYRLRVDVTTSGQAVPCYDGSIRLTEAPGTRPAPLVYCTRRDLADEADWVEDLFDSEEGMAGFLDKRALASRWVDRQAMARVARTLRSQAARHAPVVSLDPIVPASGVDGGPDWGPSTIPDTTLRSQEDAFRALLDAGALILDAPTARLTALYALHLICRNRPGKAGESAYRDMAPQYQRSAARMLPGVVFRLDADGDGLADYELR